MDKTSEALAMRVSWYAILWNAILSAGKLVAGIVGHSAAMVSDAVHSLSDVCSTLIVIVGVRLAGQSADKEHPYGHERFEDVASLILSILLCLTGLSIGYAGLQTILSGRYESLAVPGLPALVAAILSILIKEAMYWYTWAAAKKINSSALMASAWHHRSDALSSVGSFVGIFGARIGYPVLDSAACLVICLFIVKIAIDIFIQAINQMTDKSCDEETVEKIRAIVLSQERVDGVDLLYTRQFGNKVYVDVEICIDGALSLNSSHEVAHAVHDAIEGGFANVKHCMVHVNPKEPGHSPVSDIVW